MGCGYAACSLPGRQVNVNRGNARAKHALSFFGPAAFIGEKLASIASGHSLTTA